MYIVRLRCDWTMNSEKFTLLVLKICDVYSHPILPCLVNLFSLHCAFIKGILFTWKGLYQNDDFQ